MARLATALLLLGVALPAAAQEQALEPGTRVSVLMQSPNPFDGIVRRDVAFERLEGSTLWVTADEGSVALPFEGASPLVRTDEHHGQTGAILGMLAGSAMGALIGYTTYEPEYMQDYTCDIPWPGAIPRNCRDLGRKDIGSRAGSTLTGAGMGFWAGLASGYVIGRLMPKWERVERLHLSPNGLAVGITSR